MSLKFLIESRSESWARVEELLLKAKDSNLRRLSQDELLELTHLYPSVAIDLSRARALRADAALIHRLNSLAVRSHGALFRPPSSVSAASIIGFFTRAYPQLFRSLIRYVALSFTIFSLGCTASYVLVRNDPSLCYTLFPGAIDSIDGSSDLSPQDMSQRYQVLPKSALAASVTTNNIQVAFNAFSLGISFGIGSAYTLLFNGVMVGSMGAHFANHGLFPVFAEYIVGHGCLELFAIILAGASGLRLGLSLALPGQLTRGASFRVGARQSAQLVLGTIPMFVVAGLLEGFLTPSHAPTWLRWFVGVAVLLSFLAYLFFTARSPKDSVSS